MSVSEWNCARCKLERLKLTLAAFGASSDGERSKTERREIRFHPAGARLWRFEAAGGVIAHEQVRIEEFGVALNPIGKIIRRGSVVECRGDEPGPSNRGGI